MARGQHPPPEVAESCDTWQALALQGFDHLPYLWLLFSWEKESSQQKKINTKAKKRAASKLHYFTWSFSSHHRKQLFFSREKDGCSPQSHPQPPLWELSRKRHQQWLPPPLGLKAAQRPPLQPQQGLQGLGTAVPTLSQGPEPG